MSDHLPNAIRPYVPYPDPVPLPDQTPIGTDYTVQFSSVWLPYLVGVAKALTFDSTWASLDPDAVKQVVQWAHQFLDTLMTPIFGTLIRVNPSNPCQLQISSDGGTTWTLLFDASSCGGTVDYTNVVVTDPAATHNHIERGTANFGLQVSDADTNNITLMSNGHLLSTYIAGVGVTTQIDDQGTLHLGGTRVYTATPGASDQFAIIAVRDQPTGPSDRHIFVCVPRPGNSEYRKLAWVDDVPPVTTLSTLVTYRTDPNDPTYDLVATPDGTIPGQIDISLTVPSALINFDNPQYTRQDDQGALFEVNLLGGTSQAPTIPDNYTQITPILPNWITKITPTITTGNNAAPIAVVSKLNNNGDQETDPPDGNGPYHEADLQIGLPPYIADIQLDFQFGTNQGDPFDVQKSRVDRVPSSGQQDKIVLGVTIPPYPTGSIATPYPCREWALPAAGQSKTYAVEIIGGAGYYTFPRPIDAGMSIQVEPDGLWLAYSPTDATPCDYTGTGTVDSDGFKTGQLLRALIPIAGIARGPGGFDPLRTSVDPTDVFIATQQSALILTANAASNNIVMGTLYLCVTITNPDSPTVSCTLIASSTSGIAITYVGLNKWHVEVTGSANANSTDFDYAVQTESGCDAYWKITNLTNYVPTTPTNAYSVKIASHDLNADLGVYSWANSYSDSVEKDWTRSGDPHDALAIMQSVKMFYMELRSGIKWSCDVELSDTPF